MRRARFAGAPRPPASNPSRAAGSVHHERVARILTRNGSYRKDTMLWGVAVVFLLLWISGMVGAWAMGWLVHLFLVLAIVAVVLQVLRGTKASG